MYHRAVIILDVRTPEEYTQWHADGSINFDLQRMIRGELPRLPKDEEIVAYCRSGNRSDLAVKILKNHGYSNVKNAGGLDDIQELVTRPK